MVDFNFLGLTSVRGVCIYRPVQAVVDPRCRRSLNGMIGNADDRFSDIYKIDEVLAYVHAELAETIPGYD